MMILSKISVFMKKRSHQLDVIYIIQKEFFFPEYKRIEF